MPRHAHPIVWTLMMLAVFGFLVTLYQRPLKILQMLLVALAVIVVFVLIYRRWIAAKYNAGDAGYKKAARQSAKKYRQHRHAHKYHRHFKKPSHLKLINSQPFPKKPSPKKENHRLTVIDGKKRKKKNRALF